MKYIKIDDVIKLSIKAPCYCLWNIFDWLAVCLWPFSQREREREWSCWQLKSPAWQDGLAWCWLVLAGQQAGAPAQFCPPVASFPSHMFGQRPAQTVPAQDCTQSVGGCTKSKYFLQFEYYFQILFVTLFKTLYCFNFVYQKRKFWNVHFFWILMFFRKGPLRIHTRKRFNAKESFWYQNIEIVPK